MASNVTISYLADVTDLRTKSALAKSALSDVNASIREQASAFASLSDEAKGPALAALQSLTAQQKELQSEVTRAAAAIKKSTVATDEHTGALGKLHESVKITGESFEKMSASVRIWTGAASAIGEFALAGLGLERGAEFINEYAESAEGISKLAAATGLTTDELYGLRDAARETSTPFEIVQADLTKLIRSMQEAATSADSAAGRAFAAMGVKVADAHGKLLSAASVIDAVALKLSLYEDGAGKAALETAIFGRSATDLNALLNLVGKEGLAGLAQGAREAGTALTKDAMQAAEDTERHIKDLQRACEAFVNYVMGPVLNAFEALSNAPELDRHIDEVEKQIAAVEKMGTASRVAATAWGDLKYVLSYGFLADKSSTDLDYLKKTLADLQAQKAALDASQTSRNKSVLGTPTAPAPGSQEAPAFTAKTDPVKQWEAQLLELQAADGKFHAMSAAAEAAFWKEKIGQTKAGTEEQREVLQKFVESSKQAAAQGARASTKAARDQWADYKAGIEEAITADHGHLAEQLQVATEYVAEAKKRYGEDSANFKEAKKQQVEIERQIAEQKLAIARNLADAQANLDKVHAKPNADEFKPNIGLVFDDSGLNAKVAGQVHKLQIALDEQLAALAQDMKGKLSMGDVVGASEDYSKATSEMEAFTEKAQALNQQAAEAVQRSWQIITGPIGSAFDSALGVVMRGGRNTGAELARVAEGIAEDYVKSAAKVVTNWAATELEKTVLSQTGAATRTAADESGLLASMAKMLGLQATGTAAKAAQDAAQIQGDAAVAAAGAFAATASIPIVGPELAPAAAAAAYSQVSAFQVAAAEGGWDNVPYDDYPTLLHKNEMVLPRNLADSVRNMASGGLRGPALASAGSFGSPSTVRNTGGNFAATLHQTNHINTGADASSVRAEMSRAGRDAHQQMVDYYGNTGVATLPGRSVRK